MYIHDCVYIYICVCVCGMCESFICGIQRESRVQHWSAACIHATHCNTLQHTATQCNVTCMNERHALVKCN